jgi:hypothetical protein
MPRVAVRQGGSSTTFRVLNHFITISFLTDVNLDAEIR